MKDLRLYLDKLHADAEHCITISQTTLNDKKRELSVVRIFETTGCVS
jgi:hypothetical protein